MGLRICVCVAYGALWCLLAVKFVVGGLDGDCLVGYFTVSLYRFVVFVLVPY